MKKLHAGLTAACAGAAAFAGAASAEPINRGALEALFDEPVTTSATGAPQRATEAPVNMNIISQEDIRRSGAIDLPGVLERLAKIDVMRSSAGQVDVAIRGYNTTFSPRLLVLLNGRQVYLDDYGRTNWGAIPVQLAEIRQIEVVSGPNTALFGFNAVAGVVNIITFDALQDDIDEASVRVGSPAYAGGSAIWTARLAKNVGLRLSFGGFNADALPGEDATAQAFIGANGLPTELVAPRARAFAANLAYDVSERIRADIEATWSRDQRTDRYGQSVFASRYETNSVKFGLSADTETGLWQAQLYSNSLDNELKNRTTVGSLSLLAKPAPAHAVRIAGELRRNTLEQSGGDLAYDVQSLSGMWNWQAGQDLTFTTAARFDALQLGRAGSFVSPDFPFTNADFDQSFTELSYNLGVVHRISESDSLRLSGARGVGSPGLAEYGYQLDVPNAPPGQRLLISGDPRSAPTIVYNIEAGWDHQAPAIDGLVRVVLFWQKNENLRSFGTRAEVLSVSPTIVVALFPQPVGDSEMHGVEVAVEGRNGRFDWQARYSWRSIDDALTAPPSLTQLDFETTSPEHVLTGGVGWIGERFELGADARYTSETMQYGEGTALTGLYRVPAFVQANARAAWKASDRVQLELSGRNLLDSQTRTTGLTEVERSVYLTLRSSF
jgi:outer membrane receptor for ferrienterochelin and colicins